VKRLALFGATQEPSLKINPRRNDQMTNTLYLALIILAALPASAQEKATPNCPVNGDTVQMLAHDYAVQVDGLLREVHAKLQKISAQMAARQVTPEQARDLKLAATRDTVSRLDTIAALFDTELGSENSRGVLCGQAAANVRGVDNASHATRGAGTISVEELRQQGISAAVASRPEKGAQ
jgi:hypothetical protein